MILKIVIFVHIVAATVWAGGHLILSLGFLPKALKQNDFSIIESFEKGYERIGIPSLIILVGTGIYMTTIYAPDIFETGFSKHYSKHILIKFGLLLLTIALALHARLVLIPQRKLKPLAIHIIAVTIISVLLVFTGFSMRSGGML